MFFSKSKRAVRLPVVILSIYKGVNTKISIHPFIKELIKRCAF